MRLFAAVALAGLALATPAFAADVAVRPMAVESALQEKFTDDYGEREIAILQRTVARALERELKQAGATLADDAPLTVETTLVDVKPSRPTFQQAADRPGLDTLRSISVGGAELRARILGADGAVVKEIAYEWYETDLAFSNAITTWADAERAIRRFAHKVGDAYAAAPAS
ncbi:MAG: hypothetical protein NW200_15175 [Hyphomonadaceae bacterium]|nr:hypothetical protein [Hyphomonadaceae bacterium]